MRIPDLLRKKRDGGNLTGDELKFLLSGFQDGSVHNYQMSAFLMAVYFQGMNDDEIAVMTETMLNSGAVLDLSDIPGKKIDKHSTGGVGDKVSLALAPIVACAGVIVPMISGRGLGCTGGTLDKLESVPGFSACISPERFKEIVGDIGCIIAGTTDEIVPLDKKIYSLRDVTATTEPIELIASSIMSKKLAEGISGLLLDIRSGSGGNIKSDETARKLADIMTGIGRKMGKKVSCLITDMNQPTGNFIGNALEMYEAVLILQGKGPEDLKTLVVEEGVLMLSLAGIIDDPDDGRSLLRGLLDKGSGVAKFADMIGAQGGDPEYIYNPEKFLSAKDKREIISAETGYIAELHAEKVGLAAISMGAGRESIDSVIDHAVGIELLKKVGDRVDKGEPIAVLHYNDRSQIVDAERMVLDAYKFSKAKTTPPELIKGSQRL